ncbi:MAG TPA: hypothetical protein PL059_03235 [Spirochaetota bacterium]|nr:hypothetical protein [Spirochaetota bacterium]HOM09319.1 hypothetical protein [Spirochaetota bacterium]HPP50010.1 hypothetical protein [Spirochaetota bacterium]
MYIETTTCISYKHLEILKFYAEKKNMSLRTFVSSIISFAALCEKGDIQYFKQIQYRTRNEGEWKRLHLVLYNDEYEFFLDVKKLWKMSLAKVIAYCLDNVLYEFLEFLAKAEEDEDYYTDNYRYSGYTFEIGDEENIFFCKFYWGPHPTIVQKALSA